MPLPELDVPLKEADNTLDLARRLGLMCLMGEGAKELRRLCAAKPARDHLAWVEQRVASMGPELWLEADPELGFLPALDADGLRQDLEVARTMHPLEYLGVLRGLCAGVLSATFENTTGEVSLRRGMPMPVAGRPIDKLFKPTTYQRTLSRGHLLGGSGFTPVRHQSDEGIDVVLDFSCRHRLDQLTWDEQDRLPLIAGVFPIHGLEQFEINQIEPEWFFEVRPKQWEPEAVLELLASLPGDVHIAVLPELTLPEADALEEALEQHHDRYPPIVVAGSAHVCDPGDGTRSNESRAYLDGRCVLRHHKIHPFAAKHLDGKTYDPALPEGIDDGKAEIRVLAGSRTHLAIVICADLNDEVIPLLLEDAGVNLLLVPALTTDLGSFNGAATGLASRRQGITAVVNAGFDKDDSFCFFVGVPRPTPREQSEIEVAPELGQPFAALFDPNEPADLAVSFY